MTYTNSPTFLRRVLMIDAAISGATGLMLVLGATLVEGLLGLSAGLIFGAGLSLVPFSVLVAWLATREILPRAGVWAVVVCNVLWAADSILLLVSGYVTPTLIGYAFVTAQALVVAILAELEYVGLRRSPAVA
jgi:hypothetical protein